MHDCWLCISTITLFIMNTIITNIIITTIIVTKTNISNIIMLPISLWLVLCNSYYYYWPYVCVYIYIYTVYICTYTYVLGLLVPGLSSQPWYHRSYAGSEPSNSNMAKELQPGRQHPWQPALVGNIASSSYRQGNFKLAIQETLIWFGGCWW